MEEKPSGSADLNTDIVKPGEVIAGRYRIEHVIGRGGMGVVAKAWHLQFDEPVAVKFLMPQTRGVSDVVERFLREAQASFKIKNEHAAKVLDISRTDQGILYIAMEYLDGSDLATLVKDHGPQPVADSVEYVLQACEAVAEGHARGIVHRDIKPENMFLVRRADGSPCIKVLDFGLSKVNLTGHDENKRKEQRSLTGVDTVMGSPTYMAPEQWTSMKDAGPPADQWALGTVLFELVTGRPPFNAEQIPHLYAQVLTGKPPPLGKLLPEAPDGLEPVILRTLEKKVEDHYPSVAEFALALAPFASRRARESIRRAIGALREAGLVAPSTALPPSDLPNTSPQAVVTGSQEIPPLEPVSPDPYEDTVKAKAHSGEKGGDEAPENHDEPALAASGPVSQKLSPATGRSGPGSTTAAIEFGAKPSRNNGLIGALVGGAVVLVAVVAFFMLTGDQEPRSAGPTTTDMAHGARGTTLPAPSVTPTNVTNADPAASTAASASATVSIASSGTATTTSKVAAKPTKPRPTAKPKATSTAAPETTSPVATATATPTPTTTGTGKDEIWGRPD